MYSVTTGAVSPPGNQSPGYTTAPQWTPNPCIIAIPVSEFYLAKRFLVPREDKEEIMRRLLVGFLMLVVLTPEVSLAQQVQQSTGGELGRSVAAPVLSVVYFPVKLCVGIAGALLGGISGWATGGNERAAEGIWRPTVGGSYFVTPAMLEGKEPFLPFDGGTSAPPPPGTVSPGSMYQP